MGKHRAVAFAAHLTREDEKKIEHAYDSWVENYTPPKDVVIPHRVVEDAVLGFFNATRDQICNKSQKREVVQKRQILQYFLAKYTLENGTWIGYYTGGFSHSTISHSIRAVNNLQETDKLTRVQTRCINQKIKENYDRFLSVS